MVIISVNIICIHCLTKVESLERLLLSRLLERIVVEGTDADAMPTLLNVYVLERPDNSFQ